MNPEDKPLLVITVALIAAALTGAVIGYHAARHRYNRPPPPVPSVRLIGTPNYTAVDTRDPLFITFYVNTNCQSTN